MKASMAANVQQALDRDERELRESRDRTSSLRRDVHRLKARCDRAEETRSQAVEKAVTRARKHFESAETKRVKRPDGRIEDWVRDLVVELVALDGVPTAKVPQVINRVRHCFAQESDNGCNNQGGNDSKNQTISDHSVRRIMC